MEDAFVLKSNGKEINIVPKVKDLALIAEKFKETYSSKRKFFSGVHKINLLWEGDIDYSILSSLQQEGIYMEVIKKTKDELKTLSEERPLLLKRVIRSGERIQHSGDIVIDGNVNPDAYLEATGNIYIIGEHRGIAHAGYGGDENSQVFVLDCDNSQIRIAGFAKYFKKGKFSKNKKGQNFSYKNGDILMEEK